MRVYAIVLAGGKGTRLGPLTRTRAKPAVPFAGKYRIIDFTLSNCANSDISDVMVLTQYCPHSLVDHIGTGSPWGFSHKRNGGIHVHNPYQSPRGSDWYRGTADAVRQNLPFINKTQPDLVLVLSGDHVYRMDYNALIRHHLAHQADVTLSTACVPDSEASRYGIVQVGAQAEVGDFVEKPLHPPGNLANMGIYVFDPGFLECALWEDHLYNSTTHDFGRDILPYALAKGARVSAYAYPGYWVDVGTLEAYLQAHMDLLPGSDQRSAVSSQAIARNNGSAFANSSTVSPRNPLWDPTWPIYTRCEDSPPALIASGAQVADSLICDGCVIETGAIVDHCVLSPGVRVGAGTVVRESVLMGGVVVGAHANLHRTLVDKDAHIGEGSQIGEVTDGMGAWVSVVGRNSRVPNHTRLQSGNAFLPSGSPYGSPPEYAQPEAYIRPGLFTQTLKSESLARQG